MFDITKYGKINDYEFVSKGWGGEKIIVNSDKYCGKILFIMKGKMLSYHYHIDKTETMFILKGKVKILYSFSDNIEYADEEILDEGDIFHIVPELRHRIIALADSQIIEFSTLDKSTDSIRILKGD